MHLLRSAAIVVLLAAAAMPAASDAESTVRVEAESFDRAAECLPPVSIEANASASGGALLVLPYDSQCWVEWDIALPGEAREIRLTSVKPATGGTTNAFGCTGFTVSVDGSAPTRTGLHCEPLGTLVLAVPVALPSGTHTVRVGTWLPARHATDASRLDTLEVALGSSACPVNRAPMGMPDVAADGFGAPSTIPTDSFGALRDLGWQGSSYTFASGPATDPDGDPVAYRWEWGDGDPALAADPLGTAHAFATLGKRVVSLVATDDPSARDVPGCPALPSRDGQAVPVAFGVVRDYRLTFVHPSPAESCVRVRFPLHDAIYDVPTPAVQTILGRCVLEFGQDTGTDLVVDSGPLTLLMDGEPIGSTSLRVLSYDPAQHPAGFHDLDLLARPERDRYAHEFHAEVAYHFLNVPVDPPG